MINKVILLGRLGSDPMSKNLDNGRTVVNVNLATNEYFVGQDGQKKEITEWHKLEFWDAQAKAAEKYMHKGSMVFVEGRIRTDKYTDSEGTERQVKKIRVLGFQVIQSAREKDNFSSSHAETKTRLSSNEIDETLLNPEDLDF